MLLSIDPSFTSTGWALFIDNRLEGCGYVATSPKLTKPERIQHIVFKIRQELDAGYGSHLDALIIETPKIYPRSRSKGDPNKIAPLFAIVGALIASFSFDDCRLIYPSGWKGKTDKVVMFGRILANLGDVEKKIFKKEVFTSRSRSSIDKIGATSRAGDALDAIGLGLWHLGRL